MEEVPIGIRAKNLSMDIERLFRKFDDSEYDRSSDFIKNAPYQETLKLFESLKSLPKYDEALMKKFSVKYKELDGKKIDEILENKDGQQKMIEFKNDLNIIVSQ